MPLTKLQEHFDKIIPFLSHICNIDPAPDDDDEQGKVMLFKKIEDFFSGGEKHLPSIQFCDVSDKVNFTLQHQRNRAQKHKFKEISCYFQAANKNAVPLNAIPKGQSPALVILKDDSKVLVSATLIFDGSVLTTAKNPSAFDCVALLMAGYWVFHIYYPSPYEQHMETFEAILHDKISEKSRQVVRFSKMDEFFRKLTIAMST